jgi:hypothetical protein
MVKKISSRHFIGFLALILYIFLAISSMETFDAATGATTPFLQAETERLRQENDRFLNQVAMNLRIETSNYIRSLNNRSDYQNFSNDWFNVRDNLYRNALSQNTSNYVAHNLPTIFINNDPDALSVIGDIAYRRWQEAGSIGQAPRVNYRSLPGL